VGEPQDLPPPQPRAAPAARRVVWLVLIASWVALAAWAVFAYRGGQKPWQFPIPAMPVGAYHEVKEIAGPVTLRLDDGTLVRLGGLAEPATAAESGLARTRLEALAAPGTTVYVEPEPRAAGDHAGPPPASVWLPPPADRRTRPFSYSRSRLLGQVLVQDGLARVNEAEPYRYLNEFLTSQDDARRHRRGLWGPR